jgi:hypothetical protein
MPQRPCSVCGDLKTVGRDSRPDMVCRECRKDGHAPPNRNRRDQVNCHVCAVPMKGSKVPQGQAAHYKCVRKRECKVCGVVLIKGAGASGQMVCKDHRNWQSHTCDECGVKYMGTRRRRRYYCPGCSPRNAEKPPSKSKSDLDWRHCRTCESWISRPGRVYCTSECNPSKAFLSGRRLCGCGAELDKWERFCAACRPDVLAEGKRRYRRRSGAGSHRGRARRNGVYYEPVVRWRVLERDNWMCGICGSAIDRALKYPHPRCASLDHVIPLSVCADLPFGPEHGHSYLNTQAAHWDCNCIHKGANSASEQLALTG